MQKSLRASLLFLCFLLLCHTGRPSMAREVIPVPVGVILDLNSSLGAMALSCIRMGLMDFYSHNAHYATRLALQIRDSQNDVVTAASAALDLTKNEKIHAIMGPQNLEQARFVAELGTKAQVPIISISVIGPSLFPTQSDCSQFKAIAAIIEAFGWHEIIPIYEETEYGNDLIPCLTDALKEMDTRMPYRCAIDPHFEEVEISKEIDKLKGLQTQVFLVHLTIDLGSKIFKLANKEGMMSEGYAWMVTEGLSTMTDPTVLKVMGYMQGVLGVRSMVRKTKELVDFKRRWKVESNNTILTLFGLWTYDTIQMLANAVEKAKIVNFTFQKPNITNKNTIDLVNVRMYKTGSRLLYTILTTKFKGILGDFNWINGQLKPSVLEVFNIIGHNERIIGYWSSQRGLFRNVGEFDKPVGKEKLTQPIWPGDTIKKPPKLRIGVPIKKGFTESFVKVKWQSQNVTTEVSGFVIDLFSEVVKVLPFPFSYDFVPLGKKNKVTVGTYDDLLCQIKEKKLDAIVGDITILVNRTKCVDFTLPYTESSVSMVVLMGPKVGSWELLKPFDKSLWLILGIIFWAATAIIIGLEAFKRAESKEVRRKKFAELLFFPFSVYTRESKDWKSNLSKWVALIFSFLFVMVVQIYTANLTSILTEGTMPKPSFKDVAEIKRNNYSVGYQRESFVKGLLMEHLGLEESQLKAYDTPEDYHQGLSRGIKDGGVAAIFDEIPYIMLFLSKYGFDQYTMVGPKYQTDGFGFAFPRRSGLLPYISDAILNVTQDIQKLEGIKKKYSLSTPIPSECQSASNTRSLTMTDFSGFLQILAYIICALGIIVFVRFIITTCLGGQLTCSCLPEQGSPGTAGASPTPNEDIYQIISPNPNATVGDDLQNIREHVREPFIPY